MANGNFVQLRKIPRKRLPPSPAVRQSSAHVQMVGMQTTLFICAGHGLAERYHRRRPTAADTNNSSDELHAGEIRRHPLRGYRPTITTITPYETAVGTSMRSSQWQFNESAIEPPNTETPPIEAENPTLNKLPHQLRQIKVKVVNSKNQIRREIHSFVHGDGERK